MGVVSVALLAVVAALFGSTLAGGRTAPVTSGVYRSSATAAPPSSTVPTTSTTVVTTTTVPSTVPSSSVPAVVAPPPPLYSTTTTVPPPPLTAPVAPPVLTNLKPSSGAVGQPVVVTGSGFLSPSGRISATVGGRTAPVACPNQTTCTVTIPPQAAKATTVSMVIATDSGPSNPMTFRLT